MRNLVEIPIPSDATQTYIHNVLAPKENGLSSDVINHRQGWAYTAVAPLGTHPDRLCQFNIGGLCSSLESRGWLLAYCGKHLRKQKVLKYFLEDLIVDPADAWWSAPSSVDVELYSSSVIYSATLETGKLDRIVDVQSCSLSFFGSSMLVIPTQYDLGSAEFARSVLAVFITAYDQESFVVCRPKKV